MSTLSGIASKGEKAKSKFQSLDINNLYKGESLEPSQQKSTVPRCKYGMQSLGKVPSARRPPANLPSLKSESSGSEPAVSLVPTGGSGWGNKPGESQSPTPPQASISSSNANQSSAPNEVQTPLVTAASAVLTTQSATVSTGHDQTTVSVTHTATGDKSWSSIMAGESGLHPPSFLAHQSPRFQQEFPKLSSGDGQNAQTGQKGPPDTQYGPGPSLRPQTEGSWIQGGGRSQGGGSQAASLVQGPLPHHPAGVDPAGGRNNLGQHPPPGAGMGPGGPGLGIPTNGPPMHGPLHLPPGTSPQFRTMAAPFMYRGNFPAPPGTFPPNFQGGLGLPRQRFPGGYPSEQRFVSRPVDGEEIITRPIIKEEELNHMDDIARDTSWARPDEIDYNEKIVFSDTEESNLNDDNQTRKDEKSERDRESRESRESSENDKDRNRDDRDRLRERERDRDRDRRMDDRSEKRLAESNSRNWQSHSYTRLNYPPPSSRNQISVQRDRENEEEILKEKRRLQLEMVAVVTERANQRKEAEEKRYEETKRAAAKKLQMLDEKLGKSQGNDLKDREDAASTVVPLPNWLDKNRPTEVERGDRIRNNNDIIGDKAKHDFRQPSQSLPERQTGASSLRENRSRLPIGDDRLRRDYDEKEGNKPSSFRQERTRSDERDRLGRSSSDGSQAFNRHFQINIPPRFLKQQAERNQSNASSNNNYMRSSGSPQPSTQASSTGHFDPHWTHSNNAFVSQSPTAQSGGIRLGPRRFNSESSESNTDKSSRNDRDTEDWDSYDRYKSNRERSYGKLSANYFESEHNRRNGERSERRELDHDRSTEDTWERDSNRDRDSVSKEKDREKQVDDRNKNDISYEEDRDWRKSKEYKSEERDISEHEDERDLNRKEDRREERRLERPQRPDSRDSRASRESRHSRDSIRDEKSESDYKSGNGNRGFVSSLAEVHFKEDKKKGNDRRDERDRKEQNSQRHTPGPPITREKLEASEKNDSKRNLTQLKRFSEGKRAKEEKEIWIGQGLKERNSNDSWSEVPAEEEPLNAQIIKQSLEEKNLNVTSEKKENGKNGSETCKLESQEKLGKIDIKEDKDTKTDKSEEEKEKREKSNKGRGGRGRSDSNRGRQGWSVSVYRSSHGSRGDRRRRDSGRMSGRNRFSNREWNPASESEASMDEISASTESGKEDKKPDSGKTTKSRSHFKKVDKEEKNKETKKNENAENKANFQSSTNLRFDRKNEFITGAREGFAPSGQPSRRGRGSVRMRGGISHRMDGYGPPPAKSPFGHHEEKKGSVGEKGSDIIHADDRGNAGEEKGKQKSLSNPTNSANSRNNGVGGNKSGQIPPRLQKKSEMEHRDSNRNKSSRAGRHHPSKMNSDQGDDAWETTSENSEEERKNENRNMRKNYGRRGPYSRGEGLGGPTNGPRSGRGGPRSNSSSNKKFSGRDIQGCKNINTGGNNERNPSNRTYNSPNSFKNENTGKEESKTNSGNSLGQAANSEMAKTGSEENNSDLNRPTDFDDGRNKKKDNKDIPKSERRGGREKDKERRSKSSKDSGNQSQQIVLTNPTNNGAPQPLMSQVVPAPPSMAKNYERRSNLPPRLAKQRQNHRIQKQHSSELVDVNKVNHSINMFPIKESGGPPPVNAWEKPLRAPSPSKSSLQMTVNSSEPLQSDNSSQRSSPHIPREAVDKSLLDGSSPPVNTIIFENTNFKSTPTEIVIKNQFNNQLKQQRLEKGERKIGETPEEMLGFSSGKNDIPVSTERGDMKVSDSPMIYGKAEDTSDMKLDFQFETELSQLTDDKATKGMRDLTRSIQQSNMSPSTADLNFKIASVKKVWESMHTVAEHGEDSTNVSTFSPNFSPDSTMDPSAYGKAVDGSVVVSDEGNEVVYSTVPQMQVNVNYTTSKTDVSSTTSNVCKVKPQQQTVLSTGHSPLGHSGQSPLSHGGPISPPPYSTAQASQFNYQQTNIGGTAAQFGGMSAIPSPPTVLYNSSTQLPYQTFQIDGTQVLSSQAARSQFSQFPPYGMSQGLSQTSAFNQQSVYLHQTAPPTAAPDLYQSSLSQYRIQPTVGPFGQSQINSNPNTVLISSTANSLMSATVKPSTQSIGAIGTKGASPFQQNPLPSQHSQLFIPYDQVQLGVNQSYLPNSQIVQRGGPVQPSASSFYSGSGAQAGFYQGPGSALTQQGPAAPQLHQATNYSLQGFNSQSSATPVGLQSFSSQMGAQQYRTPGSVAPTTYLKSGVTSHHPTALNLAQKSSSVNNQQDVLESVFSSGPQIPSPKPRPSKQISQQQAQASPTQQTNNKFGSYQGVTQSSSPLQQPGAQRVSQTNINMQSVRNSGSSPKYPNPIQRPISYQHGTSRYKTQQRPASSVKPYFGSQDGNIKLEEASDLKPEDATQINCDSKITDNSAQSKSDRAEDDAPKD